MSSRIKSSRNFDGNTTPKEIMGWLATEIEMAGYTPDRASMTIDVTVDSDELRGDDRAVLRAVYISQHGEMWSQRKAGPSERPQDVVD